MVPMAPIARPIAAKMPANFATSKGGGGGGAGFPAATFPVAEIACNAARSSAALERAAAIFCICHRSTRASRLYGIQNAWRMLIGFSRIRTIVASQSRPFRS